MSAEWEHARAVHRDRQATSIAECALALLLEHGLSAFTMARIADGAGISRQTLYRYYGDTDAVLTAIAALLAAHEDTLGCAIDDLPDPDAQLDFFASTVIGAHPERQAESLLAALPPAGRDILDQHRQRSREILAGVLRTGVEHGRFRSDLIPDVDAQLLLGMLGAAGSDDLERVLDHIRHLVHPKENRP